MKQIFSIILLFSLTACGGWNGYHSVGLSMTPPDGPEIYQQAWKDGCQTAISANTNDFYKLFAKIKQNPKYMKEEIYRRIWQDSYNYCWFRTSSDLSQPI